MYTKNALIYKVVGYNRYPTKLGLLRDEIVSMSNMFDSLEGMTGIEKLINTFLHYAKDSVYQGLLPDFVFSEYVKSYPVEERIPISNFDLDYISKYNIYYEAISLRLPGETNELLLELYQGCSSYFDLFMFTMFVLILGSMRV